MRTSPPLIPLGILLLTGLLPGQSDADCTTSAPVIACSGGLPDGVAYFMGPGYPLPSIYYVLTVSSLTSDIAPAGGYGVHFSDSAAMGGSRENGQTSLDLTLIVDAGTYSIASDIGGVVGNTLAGDGGDSTDGNPGGAGGEGGELNLNFASGSVTTQGANAYGLFAQSVGGDGGTGGNKDPIGANAHAGPGGAGGSGEAVAIGVLAGSITQSSGSGALWAQALGGAGGTGGNAYTPSGAGYGGAGGVGGTAGSVAIGLGAATIDLTGGTGPAVLAHGVGGTGGTGGEGASDVADANGGDGGAGGNGGNLTISAGTATNPGVLGIKTSQAGQHGVQANSVAGAGGDGGPGEAKGLDAAKGHGGNGGQGGAGGTLTIDLVGASIATAGSQAQGIFARSYGGAGGNGGAGTGFRGVGGAGAGSGPGGEVDVSFSGSLATGGPEANGIIAQSIGGFSGDGGTAAGFVAYGAGEQSAGAGRDVTLAVLGSASSVQTTGGWSSALTAHSVGGGGGKGSQASGVVALGGSGSAGGNGGTVTVGNAAGVTTSGGGARAISAGSVGGGGGEGGGAGGIVALGGQSGAGGNGGIVAVTNSGNLTTSGDQAIGIFSGSHGGGGGSAHSTVGLFAIGGSGGAGGAGGTASVTNSGYVTTGGVDADAVYIQSVGGGGGHGSNAVAVSGLVSLAIGGKGGSGGDGQAASYTDNGIYTYQIATAGDRSRGVFVHSVGGGGGDGGNAISASGAPVFDIAIGASGSGGPGGNGGAASATINGDTATSGSHSTGVFVESVGGGGGAAGTTVATADGALLTYNVAVGGSGGAGGTGGQVDAVAVAEIDTLGDISHGVFAHSVGGGGGHAGTTVAGSAVSGLALTANVGGRGGNGGAGGPVAATATGLVDTQGHSAYAVNAQSIGGGGGAAYFTGSFSGVTGASIGATVGGQGGSGGDGGSVTVAGGGTLSTVGHNAAGIAAMSVAGGGGDGGTTVTASALSGGAVGVAVGGNGGSSGNGASVSVTSSANISTAGAHSEGIRAHSIAHGGGNSGTVVTANGLALGNIGVTVGGNGGAGGSSGIVTVANQGALSTSGTYATAIDAKSIAGGGGNAKGSITAAGLSMGSLTATVGGSGGSGGTAGPISVTSNAALATTGDLSHGILAGSLGGAGGEGGFAIQSGLTAGEVSGSLNVNLGGTGGGGGTGALVGVGSQGSIQTQGYHSLGVLAQSIGGNGGVGGAIYSGNVALGSTATGQANLSLGGDGGDGGVGGAVQVSNAARIGTAGHHALGILAQSIGGNGGAGGSVYTVVATVTPGSSVNIGGSVGGSGGSGNVAGTVEVDNTGAIATTGGAATAIHAQSIGGGGGRAGQAANININLTGGGNGSSFNGAFDLNVGGSGGTGNHGNTVTVNNSAALTTTGASAKGIVAHSVGGGGGDGGTASSDSIGLNGVCKIVTDGSALCSTAETPENVTQVSASLTVEIGGSGGAAGNGGAVKVTNLPAAPIATSGANAHAIVAQSHGGGGGNGGEGALGIAAWTTSQLLQDLDAVSEWSTQIGDFTSVGIGVGGSGGAAGTGGEVQVINASTLTTIGARAYGIHAQSVGGGGGNGGAGSTGFTTNITVGGRGSGGGAGGSVTVFSLAPILTQGKGALGIFAQSVGGGGGTAGDVEMGFTAEKLNIGVGVGVQQKAGVGGDGGAVSVSSGPIATTGALGHGIVAQSVGGSGGIAGISGLLQGYPLSFAGSVGDPGNAGAVTVSVNGPMAVSGQGAHGVFAQSASGKAPGNASGAVTVNVNANLSAGGQDGRAVMAQSASVDNAQNGTIAINVAQGVTVSTGPQGKETLYLLGGAANTVTNQGTLTQGNAASFVVRTNGIAQTTIDNSGTLTGQIQGATVDGAAGAGIDLHNRPGGLVNAGQLLDVRTLTNEGTLAVGGRGQVASTRVTGDLTQTGGGVLAVDLDPRRAGGSDQGDLLRVDGRAAIGGQVTVNLLDVWQPVGGMQSVPILTAAGGLAVGALTAPQSAVAQYRLDQPSPGALHLAYGIDFANPGILAATNDNQDAVAGHLHALYRAQVLDAQIARTLIAIPDTASYARVMNTLGAELAVDNQIVSLLSSIAFNDTLLSCAERAGDDRFFDQGQCGWLRLRGQRFDQQATRDNLGFGADSWQLAGGGQLDLGNAWHLGGALSYEGRNLDAKDSNASSTGDQFQAGVSAKRSWDATELAGSLAIGYGDFANDRALWPGATVSGTQQLWLFSGQLRVAHLIEQGRWAFKPRLDLGVDYLAMDGFNESGVTDFRLQADAQRDTYVNLQPAIDIATELETARGLLIRPKLTLGITQFLGNPAPSITGRFAAAPGTVPSFTASTGLDQTRFDVAAAVDLFTRQAWMVRAEVFGGFSDRTENYGGGLKVALSF